MGQRVRVTLGAVATDGTAAPGVVATELHDVVTGGDARSAGEDGDAPRSGRGAFGLSSYFLSMKQLPMKKTKFNVRISTYLSRLLKFRSLVWRNLCPSPLILVTEN